MKSEIKKYFNAYIAKSLKNSSCLVTGGTGMIGGEVVRLLKLMGAKVTSVSLDRLKPIRDVKYVYGDLSNFNFCKKLCYKKDYLFHVAGIKGSVIVTKKKPASFFVPLLMMNTNILEAARISKIKKIVYTSSIGAYAPAKIFYEDKDNFDKQPMDMFPGWAKRMAELQIKSYQIQYNMKNISIVRPSNIYGPGDNFDEKNAMVIPSLISKICKSKNGIVEVWGDGSAERDFLFSTDCAIGIIKACVLGTKMEVINLGFGKGIKIKDVISTLQSIKNFKIKYNTAKPARFHKRVMNMNKAKKAINFKPYFSLKDGLRITWDWFQKNKSQFLKRKNYF